MVCIYSLIVMYIKGFCFIKLSVLLYVTRHDCEILFYLYFFFNPNNPSFRHLRVWHVNTVDVLMSIFESRKGRSLQLVSELRLSEYLGNGGVKLIRDRVSNALE